MKTYRLRRADSSGRKIRLNRKEASTLLSFQRSPYAEPIKEIALKLLDDARAQNETEVASEFNRARVQAAKDLVATLFSDNVEMES